MKTSSYVLWSAVVFTLALLLHLARIAMSWDLVIGGWLVPVWVSGIAVIVTGFMVFSASKLHKK